MALTQSDWCPFLFGWFFNFYSVVLASAIQQHNSAIIIHTPPSSWASLPFPHPILQVITELGC